MSSTLRFVKSGSWSRVTVAPASDRPLVVTPFPRSIEWNQVKESAWAWSSVASDIPRTLIVICPILSYELIGAPIAPHLGGGPMSVELLQRVVDETTRIVDNVNEDQLGNATPCTEWTVRDIVNHITGGATMFAISAEQGKFPDDQIGQLLGGDNLGNDFKGRGERRVPRDERVRRTRSLEAGDLAVRRDARRYRGSTSRSLTSPPMRSTSRRQRARPSPTPICSIPRSSSATRMIGQEFRDMGLFAAEQPCPAGAPVADRLLVFSGRKV